MNWPDARYTRVVLPFLKRISDSSNGIVVFGLFGDLR